MTSNELLEYLYFNLLPSVYREEDARVSNVHALNYPLFRYLKSLVGTTRETSDDFRLVDRTFHITGTKIFLPKASEQYYTLSSEIPFTATMQSINLFDNTYFNGQLHPGNGGFLPSASSPFPRTTGYITIPTDTRYLTLTGASLPYDPPACTWCFYSNNTGTFISSVLNELCAEIPATATHFRLCYFKETENYLDYDHITIRGSEDRVFLSEQDSMYYCEYVAETEICDDATESEIIFYRDGVYLLSDTSVYLNHYVLDKPLFRPETVYPDYGEDSDYMMSNDSEGAMRYIVEATNDFTDLIDPLTIDAQYIQPLIESFGVTYLPEIDASYYRRLLSNIGLLTKRRGTYNCIKYLVATLTGFTKNNVNLRYERVYDIPANPTHTVARMLYIDLYGDTTECTTASGIIEQFVSMFLPFYITLAMAGVSSTPTDAGEYLFTAQYIQVFGSYYSMTENIKAKDVTYLAESTEYTCVSDENPYERYYGN